MTQRLPHILPLPAALLLAVILLQAAPAHAQWTWAIQSTGDRSEWPSAVEADADGYTYVTGTFWGEATFGGVTLLNADDNADGFLVKYGPDGDAVWARSMSATGPLITGAVEPRALAVDAGGNVYLAGRFGGTATFGGITLTAPPTSIGDAFLVKYGPDGTALWAQKVSSNASAYFQYANGVAVGPDGSVYVAGSFVGTSTFGPFALTSAGDRDLFLAKLSSDGTYAWVRRGGGTASDGGNGLAVDAAGRVYVTGNFRGTATFGTATLVSTSGADALVARYLPDGTLDWITQGSGGSDGTSGDVALDGDGNVYVAGSFGQSIAFGGITLTATGGSVDGFLVKYDPAGAVLWAERVGGTDSDNIQGLAVDALGHAYIAGDFNGTATFGDLTATSYGFFEFYLAAFTPGGDAAWVEPANGAAPSYGYDAAMYPTGEVVFAGSFVGDLSLSGIPLHNTSDPGQHDMLLARHAPAAVSSPVAVSAEPVGGGTVTIPAAGGSFQFTVALTNVTDQPQTFQAWTEVTGPANRSPVFGPLTVQLAPGATVTRTLTQQVPGAAPWGNYTYRVNVGAFPAPVTATDAFPFIKFQAQPDVRRGAGAPVAVAWSVSGWEDAAGSAATALPGGSALSEASPNPFAGVARFTLEVAEAQAVRVEVLDALGRRAALLHDGLMEAGPHVVAFDGSSLPAGVYVVRVTGEALSAARRVTLLR